MARIYSWTKTYAVNTDEDNEVAVGDVINVESQDGGSDQKVLSVTVRKTKSGKNYKTLIVEAINDK